uniref:Ninjurin a n=1 Tax=Anopheles christyi TaxID=43041 RepID=A0A182K5Z6_9DIPT
MAENKERAIEEMIEHFETTVTTSALSTDATDMNASRPDIRITSSSQNEILGESFTIAHAEDATDGSDDATSSRFMHRAMPNGIVSSALDISLLTANANQLRLLLTYNEKSRTYFVCITLVTISLVLEVLQGCGVIIMKSYPKAVPWIGMGISFLASIITVANILLAALLQL